MDRSPDQSVRESARVIKSNIFYQSEYRELIIYLFNVFTETKFTRSYLKDLVETAHIFLKMLEHFCSRHQNLIVQGKAKKRNQKKKKKSTPKTSAATTQNLEAIWDQVGPELSAVLQGQAEIPSDLTPFDAASDLTMDQQKVEAMKRIQLELKQGNFEQAVGLLRASREIWPENDSFGHTNMAPDEEFLAMREIFMTDIGLPAGLAILIHPLLLFLLTPPPHYFAQPSTAFLSPTFSWQLDSNVEEVSPHNFISLHLIIFARFMDLAEDRQQVTGGQLLPLQLTAYFPCLKGSFPLQRGSRGRSRDHWRPVLSCQNKHFPILTASRAVASKGTDRIYVVKMSGNCVAEKKKSAIKWNSDEISKFLEVFQSYELLWNCRHREYVDKQKRESAMHRLMTDIQKQGIQVPDICFLRNKIKVIKTTYRQERVKVEESKSSGKGTEDLYVPRLTCKLAKVEQSIAKLQKIAENRPKSTASASKKQDEYDAFAQHMATQLRTLPLRSFIILQEQFQSLITKERLKTMNPPPSPIMSTGSSYDDSELQPYSQKSAIENGNNEEESEDEEEDPRDIVVPEQTFKFMDFVGRFASPRVLAPVCLLLEHFEKNSHHTNHCAVKILHRVAWDCKMPALLFQASLFRTFQRIFQSSVPEHKELVKFAVFIMRKFTEMAKKNKKIFMEILFWKSKKEEEELENGYGNVKSKSHSAKNVWQEEQEDELRRLAAEYERDTPEPDAVAWIMKNMIDQTRSRKAVIKKLKELYLVVGNIKPKPVSNTVEFSEEEIAELRSLFEQYKNAQGLVSNGHSHLTINQSA
ncbi:hypothetical protein J6590_101372 [Homalodisca vitripennis]|nr:hypothetical protein J6590_101372 [Homalodisca vitripennis]